MIERDHKEKLVSREYDIKIVMILILCALSLYLHLRLMRLLIAHTNAIANEISV